MHNKPIIKFRQCIFFIEWKKIHQIEIFVIHQDLLNEGFDATSDEYYDEVNKRIRVEFPHKFDEAPQANRPAQAVAPAKRSAKAGRKTVRLTPSQVTIAKKLGVPLEEYAKYVE